MKDEKKLWFFAVLTIVLSLLLYSRILGAYFVSDDYEWWWVVRGLNFFGSLRLFLPEFWGGVVHPEFTYYRPLVAWSVWMNTVPMNMTPLSFHLTNLVIHLLVIFLVGCFAYFIYGKSRSKGILSALIFSVFPFHSEAVSYSVSGRYVMIMTLFYLLALLCWLNYWRRKENFWLWIANLAFFLALLSHESAVTLPVAAFLVWVAFRKKVSLDDVRKTGVKLVPLILVFGVYYLLRSLVLGTIQPLAEAVYMPRTVSRAMQVYILSLVIMLVLRAISKRQVKFRVFYKKTEIWIVFFLMGIFFVPTAFIPTQERHLYLASAGYAWFLSGLVGELILVFKKDKYIVRTLLATVFIYLSGCAILLYLRNERWREAGIYAESISSQLAEVVAPLTRSEKVYVVNVPDSIKGAYVFRVREKEAVEFRLGRRVSNLVFTPKTFGINSKVIVKDRRILHSTSQGGFMLFMPKRDELGNLYIEDVMYRATLVNPELLVIEFTEEDFDIEKEKVYTFERGKLRRIEVN